MKKIKFQGGITKLIASKISNSNREKFNQIIERNLDSILSNLSTQRKIAIDVVSFSSANDFSEQVLSILSFLRFTGTPISWTIYSDGSHSSQQIKLLNENFDFIIINEVKWWNCNKLPENCKRELHPYDMFFLDYAKRYPLGKKLFNYLNHRIINPCLFIDSDILFYDKASALNLIINEKVSGWYLPDKEWGCLDSRYKKSNPEQLCQVNSGFFILNKEIENFAGGLNFLKNLTLEYEYFSEQTIFHIIFNENNFIPLDSRFFVLDSADQFDFSYKYKREDIAIRHYTGPVRHKMWQKDYKWHLSIK